MLEMRPWFEGMPEKPPPDVWGRAPPFANEPTAERDEESGLPEPAAFKAFPVDMEPPCCELKALRCDSGSEKP